MVDMTIVDEWEKKVRAEERRAGQAEGQVTGVRTALLDVLATRGWPLDPDTARRIADCPDAALLQRWITRAVTASDLAAVFG